MSEFRKQRLLVKLFDSFGIQRNPYEYSDDLQSDMNASYEADDSTIRDLALTSSDPERFAILAQSLRSTKYIPVEVGSVLHILGRLKAMKQATREGSRERDNSAHHRAAHLPSLSIPEDASEIVQDADEELDQISRKLNRIHNKIGMQEGAKAALSIDSNSSIKISLFKNDFELALGSRPAEIRELSLVEDLLYVLLGSRGSFVVLGDDGFALDSTISSEVIPLISPILELAIGMEQLKGFSQRALSHSGRVLQAFGAAIDQIYLEFGQLVVAVEKKFNSGGFLLSQLIFYLRPFMERSRILYELTASISEQALTGGALLNFLQTRLAAHSGSSIHQSVIERVLIPAAQPFLDCLAVWMDEGRLEDPNGEFMIGPNPNHHNSVLDAYELKKEKIPLTLLGVADRVLLIGSYQSILRKSGTTPITINREDLVWDQKALTRSINVLSSHLNKAMLQVVGKEGGILLTLGNLKKIFFVDQLGSLSLFLQTSHAELIRPAKEVDVAWLRRRLEDSIPLQGVTCRLAEKPLYDQLLGIIGTKANGTSGTLKADGNVLRGIDALLFDYQVEFPMNLVISQDDISKYQIINRLCLSLITLSDRLSIKRSLRSSIPLKRLLATCKHSMLQFILNLQSYLVNQILQPQHNLLLKNLSTASGLDRIISLHSNYLDTCLRECLLTNAKLVQLLASLTSSIDRFTIILEAIHSPSANIPAEEEIIRQVQALQEHFSKNLRIFLEALQYYSARDSDHYLGNLLSQLDFNSFYYASAKVNDAHPVGGLAASS